MRNGKRITFIIPTYNEMRTVGSVAEIAAAWNKDADVIIVNDGSTDGTRKVLGLLGKRIRVLTHKKNLGKGYALAAGIAAAKGDIVVFLDADTCGLTVRAIDALVAPVMAGKADMTYGMVRFFRRPKKGPKKHITGFRAVRKSLLIQFLSEMKTSGYGVEWVLNGIFPLERTKEVEMPYVYIIDKFAKSDFMSTFLSYSREGIEILPALLRALVRKLLRYGRG